MMQYSWFNDYSGQIAFEGWSMSYYNVIFTILPPLVIGIFDQFVSARMLDRYPQLYQLGQQNYFFTPHTFFYWVGNAFYHSVVSTFLCSSNHADWLGTVLLLVCCLLWGPDFERWQSFRTLGVGNDTVHGCLAHRTR
jgi:hypothetical protein